MSALGGRSVVVTRPRAQAGGVVELLRTRGAHPVLFPCIEIRPADDPGPLDRALGRLERYQWVVFTSANAVLETWNRLAVAGLSTLPGALRIAAVGPATAEALRARGVRVEVVPDVHSGTGLATALPEVAGRRVLFPRADRGREETLAALREAGAVVEAVTAYHTVPTAPDPEGLGALRDGVDAVTFTAPSAVRNFAAMLGAAARPLLGRTVVACLGPTTAAAVRTLRLPEPIRAASATVEALVEALEAHFRAPAAKGTS